MRCVVRTIAPIALRVSWQSPSVALLYQVDSRLVSALDTRKRVKLLLLFLYIAGVPVPARGQETSRPLKYAITKQCQEKCGLTHGNLMELSLDTLPRNGGGRDLVHIGP